MTELAVRDQWSVSAELRDPALTYARFDEICTMLGFLNTEMRFAIGDAINIGPQVLGDEAYQALEKLRLSEESMREHARVSAAIPLSLRRKTEALSWSHYRAVSALPTLDERQEWLSRSLSESLSHHELRAALKERAGANPPAAAPARPICECCGRTL